MSLPRCCPRFASSSRVRCRQGGAEGGSGGHSWVQAGARAKIKPQVHSSSSGAGLLVADGRSSRRRAGDTAAPTPNNPHQPHHTHTTHLRILQRLQLLRQRRHLGALLLGAAPPLRHLLLAALDAARQALDVLPHLEGLGVLWGKQEWGRRGGGCSGKTGRQWGWTNTRWPSLAAKPPSSWRPPLLPA